MRPVVVIDGNNLIHAKYPLDNQKIPIEIIKNTIDALTAWALREDCLVELCLDPCIIEPQKAAPLSLYVDDRKADYSVEERVLYHAFRGDPCVVVTTDSDLQATVIGIGARYISSQDFASGHGHFGFILLPPIGNIPLLLSADSTNPIEIIQEKGIRKTKEPRDHGRELQKIHQKTLEGRYKDFATPVSPEPETVTDPATVTIVDPITTLCLASCLAYLGATNTKRIS